MTFAQLKRYWHIEMLGGADKRFTWRRLHEKYRQRSRYRYLFWFRLAQYLNSSRFKFVRKRGQRLADRTAERFGIEIALGAQIGEGLFIPHPVGIVITRKAVIGKNFSIFQNTTIGQKDDASGPIRIGDNVTIGANACIIGDGLSIGSNVTVAAAAFVNKDIPAGHLYVSRFTSTQIELSDGPSPISTRHSRQTK